MKGLFARIVKAGRQAGHLPRALKLIWSASRKWTIIWFAILFIQGMLPAAIVYLTRPLVNAIADALGAGLSPETITPIIVPGVLMASAMLMIELMQSVANYVRTAQAELVQDHITELIHLKSAAVDMEFYESSEYFDRLHRARNEASNRPLNLLENLGMLGQHLITFLAMAAILLPYGLWLPVVLVLSTLPAFIVLIRYNHIEHKWWERTTAERRWTQYYNMLLTEAHVAPEIRSLSLSRHLRGEYQGVRKKLREERLSLIRRQSIARIWASLLALIFTGLAMVWILVRAIQGRATLGDLALFYQAFNQGESLMRSALNRVGEVYANTLFLGNLFEFLDLEPRVVSKKGARAIPKPLKQGIRFENVSFRYPATERYALKNFSLFIPAGKVVAIVGVNGAGKTTLLKLLCRFYDPEAGRVTIDGIDIRDLDIETLRREITILFQFPVTYQATVRENIRLGDLEKETRDQEIARAIEGAGATAIIEKLPFGLASLLGKWFPNGTDLSGGEWRRIALARAFYRDAQIVVLDEPTTFMDSWAEAEWLDRFRDMVEGRTALIITHHFTTAMRADIIYVMDGGRLVESGTHEELVEKGGMYARSWTSQTRTGRRAAEESTIL